MSDEDLRDLLAQLHARLGRAKSLDGDSRKLLATVARDIETALGKSTTPRTTLEPIEAARGALRSGPPCDRGRAAPDRRYAREGGNLRDPPRGGRAASAGGVSNGDGSLAHARVVTA